MCAATRTVMRRRTTRMQPVGRERVGLCGSACGVHAHTHTHTHTHTDMHTRIHLVILEHKVLNTHATLVHVHHVVANPRHTSGLSAGRVSVSRTDLCVHTHTHTHTHTYIRRAHIAHSCPWPSGCDSEKWARGVVCVLTHFTQGRTPIPQPPDSSPIPPVHSTTHRTSVLAHTAHARQQGLCPPRVRGC